MVALRASGLLLAVLLLAGCQSAPIGALPENLATAPIRAAEDAVPASSLLRSGGDVAAPSGFLDFCRRNPQQCASGAPVTVTLDSVLWHTLVTVNDAWNTAIKPMDDDAHYGRADYWTIPADGYGDCEDYALGKRQSLVERAIPASALSIALVHTRKGVPHAVLTVRTDHGDYVLDSLNPAVLPWLATGYDWMARQASGERWVSLDAASNVRVAGIAP